MSKIEILRTLALDCRQQGEQDIAEAIDSIVMSILKLCACVRSERVAADAGDTLEWLEKRTATSLEIAVLIGRAGEGHE